MKNCLRDLRKARGWTQEDLAIELGVSRQTVNALEAGRYDPSLPLAFGIARLFDLAIEEVFEDGLEPPLRASRIRA
ncbi:MAG TPA: helix-turn-helix transcriptional regulator [Croceibacterium sp.]